MRFLDPKSLAQHTDRLYRAAWALCGSREDAEDLVQETFLRVLARPRLLRGDQTELAYMLRVLRNTFLTTRRDASRRPRATATLDDVVVPESRPTMAPDKAVEVSDVYAAIAELPERFRLALVAVDLLGLSYKEAARVLDVREQTLTTRLFRARQMMARRFAEADVDIDHGAGPRAPAEPGAGHPAEDSPTAEPSPATKKPAADPATTRAAPEGVTAAPAAKDVTAVPAPEETTVEPVHERGAPESGKAGRRPVPERATRRRSR